MCMTSAVTGYFKILGSDTPPTSYEDIELADMVTHWGHNARGAHPIVFWRIADHKSKRAFPRWWSTRGAPAPCRATRRSTQELLPLLDHQRRHRDPQRHRPRAAHQARRRGRVGLPQEAHHRLADLRRRRARSATPRSRSKHITMIDPKYLREVAALWAEASIKGTQARHGRRAVVLGHRLQPAPPRPEQHRQPDQPDGALGQHRASGLRPVLDDRSAQRHGRAPDRRPDRALALQPGLGNARGATGSPTLASARRALAGVRSCRTPATPSA